MIVSFDSFKVKLTHLDQRVLMMNINRTESSLPQCYWIISIPYDFHQT
jgi:hypothetical protein